MKEWFISETSDGCTKTSHITATYDDIRTLVETKVASSGYYRMTGLINGISGSAKGLKITAITGTAA